MGLGDLVTVHMESTRELGCIPVSRLLPVDLQPQFQPRGNTCPVGTCDRMPRVWLKLPNCNGKMTECNDNVEEEIGNATTGHGHEPTNKCPTTTKIFLHDARMKTTRNKTIKHNRTKLLCLAKEGVAGPIQEPLGIIKCGSRDLDPSTRLATHPPGPLPPCACCRATGTVAPPPRPAPLPAPTLQLIQQGRRSVQCNPDGARERSVPWTL